jgi:predicted nucleic acid-binding protein
MKQTGKLVSPLPLETPLPDPDDEPFLEVSMTGKAKCLITGNKAHYPAVSRQGTKVFSPSEFLEYYRKQSDIPEPEA